MALRSHSMKPGSPKPSSGFSLIEVLIALALTVLLLSAVYSAVGLHLRFQTAGRSRVHSAQLMRAIVRNMDEDFAAVVMYVEQADEEDESTSIEETEPIEDVADTALTVGGLETEGTPITFGVVGTSEFLHLCVSRPLRDLSYDSLYTESPTSGRSNDLLTVTYSTGPVDISRLVDPTRPKYDDPDPALFSNRPPTGLGRRAVDLYSFDAATDILTENDVITPQITEISFAYFDGTAWLDSWDSRTLGALPRAVRVTFGLWSEGDQKTSSGVNRLNSGSVYNIEHTFFIPASVPILE